MFVSTLGSRTEIVVHDLRSLDASVIAIAGTLTSRVVGAPIPDPEFMPERLQTLTEDEVLYCTQTLDGRQLCSSTVWIRDIAGIIRGAVCINVDQGEFRHAHQLLNQIVAGMPTIGGAPDQDAKPPLTTFARNVDDFVEAALDQIWRSLGKPMHQWTRTDRIRAIMELEAQGVFHMRHSVETVAGKMGVSRATIFAYLREVRNSALEHGEAVE